MSLALGPPCSIIAIDQEDQQRFGEVAKLAKVKLFKMTALRYYLHRSRFITAMLSQTLNVIAQVKKYLEQQRLDRKDEVCNIIVVFERSRTEGLVFKSK